MGKFYYAKTVMEGKKDKLDSHDQRLPFSTHKDSIANASGPFSSLRSSEKIQIAVV